jgi:hypothetical protein
MIVRDKSYQKNKVYDIIGEIKSLSKKDFQSFTQQLVKQETELANNLSFSIDVNFQEIGK